MTTTPKPTGKTTIAPEVLVTICKLTALSVQGVSRLAATTPSDVNRFFNRGAGEGVKISVDDDTVYVDLYIIVTHGYNVRDVSHKIQQKITRALSEMVGMDVGKINIHIEDIDYSALKK